MGILRVPDLQLTYTDFDQIKQFLEKRGIWHARWHASKKLKNDATEADILHAYRDSLQAFMQQGDYKVADVINIHEATPEIAVLRAKFICEHTHTEDEVRFFIDGEGLFWFHQGDEVYSLLCQAGDLISIPAQTKHWFDLGPQAFVKAIRIFTDRTGWVPHYTHSCIDAKYNSQY